MANMSDAVGSITINVKTEDEGIFLKAWSIIREGMDSFGDFSTYLDTIDSADIDHEGKWCSASAGFSAFGRWVYMRNVKRLGAWLENVISDDNKELLVSLEFSLIYEFADYEVGEQILYKAEMTSHHTAGDPLSCMSSETVYDEDIPITAQNLIDCELFDEGDIADMNMPREEAEEWFCKNNPLQRAVIHSVFENDAAYGKAKADLDGQIFGKNEASRIDWNKYAED